MIPRRLSTPHQFVLWAKWPILLAPLTILLHELGHFLAAVALGFPDPQIHFSSISHGDISDRPGWQPGLVGLAGPVVTASFVLAGLWLSSRRPSEPVGYALAVAAASRFFVGVPYTIANLLALVSGRKLDPPAFDEFKAGEALGWSGNLTLGVTASMVFLVLGWLFFRLPTGQRGVAWAGLIVGTIAGWAFWFSIAPVVLP